MTVVIILGVLLVALMIIVPLLERSSFRMSEQQMAGVGRWILPLCILLATIQLIRYIVN